MLRLPSRRDLSAAPERYRRLGFAVRAHRARDRYGYADRGRVSIRLSEWDGHDPAGTRSVIYLYVSDADAVREQWIATGVDGRSSEAHDSEYRMRELGYVDPDGTLHRVGSRIPKG